MTNGYILEIKTSLSHIGGVGIKEKDGSNNKLDGHIDNKNNSNNINSIVKDNVVNNNENNTDSNENFKEQFKGISFKDNNDLLLSRSTGRSTSIDSNNIKKSKRTNGHNSSTTNNSKRHHRKISSNSLDKYIKFTVKKSDHCNNDEVLYQIGKFMVIFLSIGLFWRVLNNVDAIGKSLGGYNKLQEINEIILKEYYLIIKNLNIKNEVLIRFLDETNSIVLIIKKFVNGLRMNRNHKEYLLIQDIISLIYLGISVIVINEIYWRVCHSIEESLIIIPHLGVQTESILIKENIWDVLRKILGLNHIYNNNIEEIEEVEEKREKGIIINRQFVTMEYVKDIVINEGFKGFEVIFYMTLIMEEGVIINNEMDNNNDKEAKLKMIVVFPNLLPRRAILETVFRKSREYLRK